MTEQQQRYRVIDRLAAGGMAEVFIAESAGIEGFKKRVAIKRVLPHLSEKKRFIAMFLDEARLSAHLSHSNVVQVFDIGVGDNTYFIVMEYVLGADLKHVISHAQKQGRRFPIEAAVYICIKMCEGLAYAHGVKNAEGEPLKIVHRDISPPNVLISRHGEVKIVDFGLAKASTQLEKSEAGIIKGKFSYLSPEAAHGQEVDARADIFAVGIILWEMLAGRRLFRGKSDYETVKQVQAAKVPSIRDIHSEADELLQSILNRALAQDRAKRYGSAQAFAQDLSRFLYRLGKPVSAFDIGQLVTAAMGTQSSGEASEGASIIGKLIQETLFQFTSLQDKAEGAGGQKKKVSGLNITGLDGLLGNGPASDGAARLVRNTLPAYAFEEGNLAALEDLEAPEPSSSRLGASGSGRISALPPSAPSPATASISGPAATAPASRSGAIAAPVSASASHQALAPVAADEAGSGSLVKVLLVVLIAIGAAVAVFFSGLV